MPRRKNGQATAVMALRLCSSCAACAAVRPGKTGLFIVRDGGGQALGYFYFVDEKEQRPVFKHLTREEAHQIATAVAKLPELTFKP